MFHKMQGGLVMVTDLKGGRSDGRTQHLVCELLSSTAKNGNVIDKVHIST